MIKIINNARLGHIGLTPWVYKSMYTLEQPYNYYNLLVIHTPILSQ